MYLLAGCAQYRRQPLTLDRYAEDWMAQEIDVESVRQFSARLADTEQAETFNANDGLSLAEAEAVALMLNPHLRVARAQAEVPLAGAREAGWWPDPEFQAQVLRYLDRGRKTRFRLQGPSFDGANAGGLETTPPGFRRVEGDYIEDPWIVGASLSLTIPLSGRLAVEKDLAWSQYSATWRQILIAEWELLTRLRAAWLEWSLTNQQIALTRDYLVRLREVMESADRLAAAGELKPTDARVLLIELSRQRMALQALEAEAEQQRLELFAMLGMASEAPITLEPDLFVPEIGVANDERRSALLRSDPRLRAAQADYEAAEQRLRLEIRKQYPDLTIGPGYSFEEGFSRLGFGFGFPIPLWNRNRQAIAEAIAEREAARTRAETQVELVFAEWAQAEARLRAAEERRALLLNEVAPLVDRQVQETRKLLGLGEIDVLLLREALSASLKTKMDILEATLAEALAADALRQVLRPRWVTPSQAEPGKDKR
jgi:outer membrane protein TolC